jgi:hypothetical protein
VCDIHVSLKLFSHDVKQVTVVIDERLIIKCETQKEQRKISLHESHISRPRSAAARSVDDKSLLQNLTQFHAVYWQRQTLTWDTTLTVQSCLKSLWVQLINQPVSLKPASEQISSQPLYYTDEPYVGLSRRLRLKVKRCALHTREGNLNSFTCYKHHANVLMQEYWHDLT